MPPFSLPYTCSNKKKLFSFYPAHNLYFALLTQFFGNNRTPKQFGVKGFQNSPLFLHYLFFLVFYCATRTRHAKQKVWSALACRAKATVTSVVLLTYAHMPCYMSRSSCRGMHACPCHHLFVGFPVDGHISIGDTKDIFCFILQSVVSVQEVVCFCCLFKFYRV